MSYHIARSRVYIVDLEHINISEEQFKLPINIQKLPLKVQTVSEAGGLGFLAGGFDVSPLESNLEEAVRLVKKSTELEHFNAGAGTGILPIGVGFLNWGTDLTKSIAAIEKYRLCATKVWVQVGTVAEAIAVAEAPSLDVLVVQGSDAGGRGLAQSASIITLVPETDDIPLLVAGGIADRRGLAAALALGVSGAVTGTRFLALSETKIAPGYQNEVLRASDGGTISVRSTVYDRVRETLSWPTRYGGRGIITRAIALYEEELKKGGVGWGPDARITTYAGTGVGLVKERLRASEITANVIQEAQDIIRRLKE
ncbi:Nitronate monooxygenase-domain-containing protein [Aspergillus carlsbadensis]|nr:Nitronate monooxygenase-domain-containing protein [Aspergillus carlsbadensis]